MSKLKNKGKMSFRKHLYRVIVGLGVVVITAMILVAALEGKQTLAERRLQCCLECCENLLESTKRSITEEAIPAFNRFETAGPSVDVCFPVKPAAGVDEPLCLAYYLDSLSLRLRKAIDIKDSEEAARILKDVTERLKQIRGRVATLDKDSTREALKDACACLERACNAFEKLRKLHNPQIWDIPAEDLRYELFWLLFKYRQAVREWREAVQNLHEEIIDNCELVGHIVESLQAQKIHKRPGGEGLAGKLNATPSLTDQIRSAERRPRDPFTQAALAAAYMELAEGHRCLLPARRGDAVQKSLADSIWGLLTRELGEATSESICYYAAAAAGFVKAARLLPSDSLYDEYRTIYLTKASQCAMAVETSLVLRESTLSLALANAALRNDDELPADTNIVGDLLVVKGSAFARLGLRTEVQKMVYMVNPRVECHLDYGWMSNEASVTNSGIVPLRHVFVLAKRVSKDSTVEREVYYVPVLGPNQKVVVANAFKGCWARTEAKLECRYSCCETRWLIGQQEKRRLLDAARTFSGYATYLVSGDGRRFEARQTVPAELKISAPDYPVDEDNGHVPFISQHGLLLTVGEDRWPLRARFDGDVLRAVTNGCHFVAFFDHDETLFAVMVPDEGIKDDAGLFAMYLQVPDSSPKSGS